jgi:hypothetical protein
MKKFLKGLSKTRKQDLAVCLIGIAMVLLATVVK